MIPLIIQDQFFTVKNLQRSPIQQASNWPGTFFVVSYSKPALAKSLYVSFLVRGKKEKFSSKFLLTKFKRNEMFVLFSPKFSEKKSDDFVDLNLA